ncbi:nitrile hydratase subunit alpha [Paenarthrobacter aurescens]|jgi:nitrile hydratase|uniref:nitrile hydratase n=1 Tax=Paenarthrobacter aurescens (strain TC1) TaxID=290340 RepID=A1RDJ2_PAEAT|nr:nitrile hydratase subunit alpha [Paenarthrobacter aurescens]ABM10675.1 Nitrile hydratase, alpha subunit [Paenarthrobacter aurescens TC1]
MSGVIKSQEEIAARVKALESMLIDQGVMTTSMVDRMAEIFENEVGPQLGAKVVAKAWTDPDYKAKLLKDGTAACKDLGYTGLQGEDMKFVENTDDVHNTIVCTLCSCYPWPVLGLPPNWYKEPQYRSRVVRDPRGLLKDEFDFEVSPEKEIRVWDSSSEMRFIVIPQRPAGTDGWNEEQLADLVTRNSMVGVGPAKAAQ